jgi:glycosyltransferase involved in cell wall biosynthesis
MKITVVQGAFLPVPPLLGGAIEKWWFYLCKEFARRGHSVTHVSRTFPGLPERETVHGVNHIRVGGFKSPKSLVWLKTLDLFYSLRTIRVLPRADILVTNTFWLPILCQRRDAGLIYVHVARFPKGQMRLYYRAARLQAVSCAVRDAILEQAPGLAGKVCVKSVPLSDDMLAHTSPRTKVNYLLCYAGRIHPEKGLELLLKAFLLLIHRGLQTWRLRLIGPWEVSQGGGGSAFLQQLKKISAGFEYRVEFLEPEFNEASLRKNYEQSDLFIYPSLAESGESFGAAPLEAMAADCPALVSNLACFRDFIRDDENGFVFDHRAPDNVSELARKLETLLQNPGRLLTAGKMARTTAENFSIPRVADQYLEDFELVMQQCKR